MKLIVKISVNKNQNQMKIVVETQTECETDDKSDTEFTPNRMLKKGSSKN